MTTYTDIASDEISFTIEKNKEIFVMLDEHDLSDLFERIEDKIENIKNERRKKIIANREGQGNK